MRQCIEQSPECWQSILALKNIRHCAALRKQNNAFGGNSVERKLPIDDWVKEVDTWLLFANGLCE